MSFMTQECQRESWEYYFQTGKYARRIKEIIQVMWHSQPMNQTQTINAVRQLTGNSQLTDHAITPRFAPMLRAGIIKEVYKRPCPITNRTTTFYSLTYEKPIMSIKEASVALGRVRLKDLESENRKLKEENERLRAELAEARRPGQLSLF